MNKTKLIFGGVLSVFLLILCMFLFEVAYVAGNEVGVLESWSGGVSSESLQPRTYFFFPGFWYRVYTYDMSSQAYVMNDNTTDEYGNGRAKDAYLIQSSEGQDMWVSMAIRWRRDPSKIVELHKTVREHVEEKIIRPELMRIAKDASTKRKAIDAYSGNGLVELQQEIFSNLTKGELKDRGVIVENFVIEGIRLDPEYLGEIRHRQVAEQKELREHAEQKAALAAAERAKAEARANYEKAVVEAERDKQVGILEAEKKKEQLVMNAQAEKEQQVLAAEGEKEASELRAAAVLAMGQAEAEAKKLQLGAYAVQGADAFVQIEVAKSMAEAFKNVKGYLPESMKLNLLSGSFNDAVESFIGRTGAVEPAVDTVK